MLTVEKIRNREAKIAIYGLGYVGLPTALEFADKGFYVVGVDIKEEIVKKLNSGEPHIKELNLDDKLKKALREKRFRATADGLEAIKECDVAVICVPTPIDEAKIPNLKPVFSAAETIAKGLSKGKLVVLESTVHPTFCEEELIPFIEDISGLKAGRDFGLAHVPERYNPGDEEHTIEKIVRVVGAVDDYWLNITLELYKTIVKGVYPVKDLRTAEAAKIIENIQRDLNIALMNELALLFEKLNIDVYEVIEAASTKWNFVKFYPGAGVGGHCLPVDPYYLTFKAQRIGFHPKIILAGRSVNDYMPYHVVELIIKGLNKIGKAVKNSKIVVLGLSYKANVGDFRNSPSETIVKKLNELEADIYVHDPFINSEIEGIYEKVAKISKPYEIFENADAIVLVTDHDFYRTLDLKKIKEISNKDCLIVDGRGFFNPQDMKKLGFRYTGVGRRFL